MSTLITDKTSTIKTEQLPSKTKWHEKAACRGPQQTVFYPPSRLERRPDKRRREQRAKEICAECPVQAECLDHAFAIREQHGIWGGLTERERKALITGH